MSLMLGMITLAAAAAGASEPSQAKAHAADVEACAAGDARACVKGASRTWAGAPGVMMDRIATYDLLKAACELGDQQGCVQLGWSYVNHRGAVHDPPAAGPLWEAACAAGQPKGCADWGRFLVSGLVETPDPVRAAAAFAPACDAEQASACWMLGLQTWRGHGVAADPVAARGLLARACTLGDKQACGSLGLMQELGHGGPADPDLAVATWQAACDKVDGDETCGHLARMLVQGHEVEVEGSPTRFIQRASERGLDAGRLAMAMALQEGLGGLRRDPAEARRALRGICSDDALDRCEGPVGCDWVTATACHRLALDVPDDPSQAPDPALVQRLRSAACTNMVDEACEPERAHIRPPAPVDGGDTPRP